MFETLEAMSEEITLQGVAEMKLTVSSTHRIYETFKRIRDLQRQKTYLS